jgi:hypothetical protein
MGVKFPRLALGTGDTPMSWPTGMTVGQVSSKEFGGFMLRIGERVSHAVLPVANDDHRIESRGLPACCDFNTRRGRPASTR